MTTRQSEPHYWTATETLEALRSGRIGALELLDQLLDRKGRLDGAINAVVEIDPEAARAAAREADARRDENRVLNGLPMTVKDTYEVAGFHATAGIPDLADYRPAHDADAIARLRAAGAVIYGKTNVPVAASDHQTYNPIHGVTRNPWDTDRTVGGSSGGAAAALAAGFTSLELGSDIGGSIRIPSHYCGVWGHKPSYGIIPSRGHIPPMPGSLSPTPLAVCGPLARSSADLELALDVLAGGKLGGAWVLNLPKARHDKLADFRVAVWTGGYPVDPAYAAGIEAFAGALEKEGVKITRLGAAPDHMAGADDLYLKMLFAVIGSGSPEAELAAYQAVAAARSGDELAATIAGATRSSAAEFGVMVEQQARLIAAWEGWFADYDILLCPVSMTVAFPHQTEDGYGPVAQLNRTLDVGGEQRPYLENLYWPGIATLAHLPATVRPLPEKVHGLPAGVQIIGPGLEDHTPLAFAKLCDAAFGGFVSPFGA